MRKCKTKEIISQVQWLEHELHPGIVNSSAGSFSEKNLSKLSPRRFETSMMLSSPDMKVHALPA